MTKQEALEYWSCLSEAELIIRLGLYYDRVAELEAQMSTKWPGVWQPIEQNGLIDVGAGRNMHIEDEGLWVGFDDLDGNTVGAFLPDGIAICRKA